jgi:hypothetical protein
VTVPFLLLTKCIIKPLEFKVSGLSGRESYISETRKKNRNQIF